MKSMQNQNNPFREINLTHLRTFLVLAQLGNFSQTGQRVGLSQPAVSRHIQALEETLGVRLFERLGRKAMLTSAGETLRGRLEILTREVESLPRLLQDLSEGVQGEVRIASSTTAANGILPSLLGKYRRKYPRVELMLQPANN